MKHSTILWLSATLSLVPAFAGCGGDDDDGGTAAAGGGAGGSAGSGGSSKGGASAKGGSAGETGKGGEAAGGEAAGGAGGQPAAIELSTAAALALGAKHSCAIDESGGAWCWGDNLYQQLGSGMVDQVISEPVPVDTTLKFKAIAAGDQHTCAISVDDDAYCWGSNDYGQGGIGLKGLPIPVSPVDGGLKFASITAGPYYTCGVTTDGDGYCWGGRNDINGILGDGSGMDQVDPSPLAGDHGWKMLAAGFSVNLGVADDGQAYAWGSNTVGQLGIGSSDSDPHGTPEAADSTLVFEIIAAGNSHGCAATAAGDTSCWGANDGWQLGSGSAPMATSPQAVSGSQKFLRLAAGTSHSCGLTGAGAAYCWGSNTSGNLGDGIANSPFARNEPYAVSGSHVFVAIEAGGHHSCAVEPDGTLFCWGSNASGELGLGIEDTTAHTMPLEVMLTVMH